MTKVDYAYEWRSLIYGEEGGDIAVVRAFDHKILFCLIDVLGHGKEAGKVAAKAAAYVDDHFRDDPEFLLRGLHRYMKGSRGAVASICMFDTITGALEHVGVGNITVRLKGRNNQRLMSRDGIVGYGTIHPSGKTYWMQPGDTLVMYSDGVKEHFDFLECGDLFSGEAVNIVRGILNRYGKGQDDESCVVMKYI